MEQRIRNFMDITKQLVEASYDYLYRVNANGDWRNSLKEMELLKEHLNEAVKTLSSEELTEIIEKDLKTCVDYKTADPLLWICGLDLKELPKSVPLVNSGVGVEYSPGVRIDIGPGEYQGLELKKLRFSVYKESKNYSYRDCFSLYNMRGTFLSLLNKAEHAKDKALGEDEEKTTNKKFERINNFIDLKEKLVEVSLKCHHKAVYDELKEKSLLEIQLNKAFKALSKDEFAEIVNADLQTCIDCKTADPLLWICELDHRDLPTGTAFRAEYSPGLWICIGTNAVGPYFSVEATGEKERSSTYYFSEYNVGSKFSYILEMAEVAKGEIEGEELTDEEPDEDHDEL